MTSKVLIVTGMHASGVFTTGNLLRKYNALDAILCKDSAFVELHNEILADHGLDYPVRLKSPILVDSSKSEVARDLIKKNSTSTCWGWSDPNTILFSEFWLQMIESSHFLFVFRHPIEVFLSLLSKPSSLIVENPITGILAWQTYAELLLKFIQNHPGQSTLCHIHAILNDPNCLFSVIDKKLGFHKADSSIKKIPQNYLKKINIPPSVETLLGDRFPDVLRLYEQLQVRADMAFEPIDSNFGTDSSDFMEFLTKALFGYHRKVRDCFFELSRAHYVRQYIGKDFTNVLQYGDLYVEHNVLKKNFRQLEKDRKDLLNRFEHVQNKLTLRKRQHQKLEKDHKDLLNRFEHVQNKLTLRKAAHENLLTSIETIRQSDTFQIAEFLSQSPVTHRITTVFIMIFTRLSDWLSKNWPKRRQK